ncbi:predicted protein [Nematostella vectensis]|uniref:Uncharacterized protein n=1 Tax=Nematostella vectensis TaxID=45351 RepID=A7SJ59_NEMVE|nr:predicted protein [Nematostella vectensis]|eukprot:XP_001628302.1 predicted protein [Nematostella vectensis]
MSRRQIIEKQKALGSVNNICQSKTGEAILKKNIFETRVLRSKLSEIEEEQRRWKSSFSWEVKETQKEARSRIHAKKITFRDAVHMAVAVKRLQVGAKLNKEQGDTSSQDKDLENETEEQPRLNQDRKDSSKAQRNTPPSRARTESEVDLKTSDSVVEDVEVIRTPRDHGTDFAARHQTKLSNYTSTSKRKQSADSKRAEKTPTENATSEKEQKPVDSQNRAETSFSYKKKSKKRGENDVYDPVNIRIRYSKSLSSSFTPNPFPPRRKVTWCSSARKVNLARNAASAFADGRMKGKASSESGDKISITPNPVAMTPMLDRRFLELTAALVPMHESPEHSSDEGEGASEEDNEKSRENEAVTSQEASTPVIIPFP